MGDDSGSARCRRRGKVPTRVAAAGASFALREKERELEAAMSDDVAVAMVTVTCSTKYVNGVNLPVLG